MTPDAQKAMLKIADAMDALRELPPGRERSLAQTKLDEAMMWTERAGRETHNAAAAVGSNVD